MDNMSFMHMPGCFPHMQATMPIAPHHIEQLECMYPQIYHVVFPKIRDMCMMMDLPGNPDMFPCPRREVVERMVDDIYARVVAEIGDPEGYEGFAGADGRQFGVFGGFTPFGGFGFGRRRLLRDIIGILLLRQLIGRRRFGFGF